MTQRTVPAFPPGRYGKRREPRRASRSWAAILVALVVVVALAVTVVLYRKYGNPAYQAQVTRYAEVSDTGLTVTFTVRKPDGRPAVCRLRALDRSGAEIGYAEVPVGPGTEVTVSYQLPTTGRPRAADVLGCAPAS